MKNAPTQTTDRSALDRSDFNPLLAKSCNCWRGNMRSPFACKTCRDWSEMLTKLSTRGSYYGVTPVKMPNRQLLWPADAVQRLTPKQGA